MTLDDIISSVLIPFGSAILGGFIVQHFTGRRERATKIYEIRAKLYDEVLDAITKVYEAKGKWQPTGEPIPPIEFQQEWLRISHRLKLFSTAETCRLFDEFRKIAWKELQGDMQFKPRNPGEVSDCGNRVIECMAKSLARFEIETDL